MTTAEWYAQPPCPECNSRPGYNPETGVAVDGTPHTWGCSHYGEP